jgi:hypothetical protein
MFHDKERKRFALTGITIIKIDFIKGNKKRKIG